MTEEITVPAGWTYTEARCPYCRWEWIAVHPVGVERLECPACRSMPSPASARILGIAKGHKLL